MRFLLLGPRAVREGLAAIRRHDGRRCCSTSPRVDRAARRCAVRLCRPRRPVHLLDARNLLRPRELQPLPLLGVPGWWPDNEAKRSTTTAITSARAARPPPRQKAAAG